MTKYQAQYAWQKDGPLIARMHEVTEFSGGGVCCVIFLVLSAVGTFVGLMAANNAVQQAGAGVAGLAWIITFGIGAIIGRRRTYYVHRFVEEPEKKVS